MTREKRERTREATPAQLWVEEALPWSSRRGGPVPKRRWCQRTPPASVYRPTSGYGQIGPCRSGPGGCLNGASQERGVRPTSRAPPQRSP